MKRIADGAWLLIAGDVFINVLGLPDPLRFEDAEAGRRSQHRIATLDFQAVAFGYGPAITLGAASRIRRKLDL